MSTDATAAKPQVEEPTGAERTRCERCYRPNVDILEKADELLVLADMPGAAADRIDVNFEEGTLTIHARVEPRRPADAEHLLQEYGVGDFYRTFQISEAVDVSRISAEYADGVLTLHLPKSEATRPRRIAVKAS